MRGRRPSERKQARTQGLCPPHPQDLALCCLSRSGPLLASEMGMPKHPHFDPVEATETALGLLPSVGPYPPLSSG